MTSINSLPSFNSQQNLVEAQNALTETVRQLSSGKRINSAQDDAATLAITQNMVGQILAINRSVMNLNNATNLLQVADTGLGSLQDLYVRINQLAVAGRNDSLDSSQQLAIVKELSDINNEINRVIKDTRLNGNTLFSNFGILNSESGLKVNRTNVGTLDDTFASLIEVSGARPGIYKFSNLGANLTLTKTDYNDNALGSQTLTLRTPVGSKNTDVIQGLYYGDFGVYIQLTSRTKPNNVNDLTDSGQEIAQKLSNIFKPIIVDEAIKYEFGAGTNNSSLISFRPINLRTEAKPDLEIDPATQNKNGVSNTNPSIMQVLPSPTTAQGSYNITTSQSAAATEFELVGFSGTGSAGGLSNANSVGINAGFTLTVGNRTYNAASGAGLSGSNGQLVSINEFTNWINSLNDQNISARLYQRSTGDYSVKINGGAMGADNAVSFSNLNLAVAIDQVPGTKVYGNVSLAADGKLTTTLQNYLSGATDPSNGNPIASSISFSGYEGNNSQYLSLSGEVYSLQNNNVSSTGNGIVITTELSPTPAYNNIYPHTSSYNPIYDPTSPKYIGAAGSAGINQPPAPLASWYNTHWDKSYTYAYSAEYDQTLNRTDRYLADGVTLNPYFGLINRGTRDQPANASYARVTSSYEYGSANWNTNFTSNTYLLNSVVGIDPARDAKLSISFNGGAARSITNDTNVFTDATSGLQINLTPGRQPWDGSASATIIIGDPQPALARNNSNLVAVDRKIAEMQSYSSNNTRDQWNAAFDFLQNQTYKALDYLSHERTIVGAQMNRVEFINTNLRAQSANTEKAKSDLIDTDVAATSNRFLQQQAQLEVATRMVKEANSLVNPIKVLMQLWDDIKSK
jgi:flagellin-like hook-associated protein FlgL